LIYCRINNAYTLVRGTDTDSRARAAAAEGAEAAAAEAAGAVLRLHCLHLSLYSL